MTKIITRRLPCKLTDRQIDEYARRGARLVEDVLEAEEAAKLKAGELKAKIKALQQECVRITHCVNTGVETREVECTWEFNRFDGLAYLHRCDTGDVVQTRAMTEDELSIRLALDDVEVEA